MITKIILLKQIGLLKIEKGEFVMKKILFVLSVLVSFVLLGCSTPTSSSNTGEKPKEEKPAEKTPEKTPQTPQQPATPTQPQNPETPAQPEAPAQPETPQVPEDKSPFEYVKPDCVNLADYTYVGDYIFADTMNFAEWKYSNAETEYRLAFEKVARVKNDNPDTRISRCNHNDPDTEISVIKATRYKIYVKTSIVVSTSIGNNCFNNYSEYYYNGNYDGTVFRVKKLSDNTFEIACRYETYSDVMNNYVAY